MKSRGYRCRKRMWNALILFLYFPAVSCQQEIWQQERPPNMPQISNLEVMCAKDHMEVQLSFDRPFNGLVFSKGAFGAGECAYVQPKSGRKSYRFSIMYNGCGTKPDMNGKFYENTIVVQYDEELIEVWDEAKRLRCEWYNDYEKTATKPPMVISDLEVVELNFRGDNVDCWMEIQNGKGPWASPVTGIVPLGSTMTMVVAINDLAGEFDMRVKSCEASDGVNRPIQLSDEHGCVLRPKMVSKFLKLRNNDGRATVMTYAFFHAFKFPDSMHVHIRCKVEICRFGCPEHCERVPAGSRSDQVSYLSEVNATYLRSDESETRRSSEAERAPPQLPGPVAIPIPVKRPNEAKVPVPLPGPPRGLPEQRDSIPAFQNQPHGPFQHFPNEPVAQKSQRRKATQGSKKPAAFLLPPTYAEDRSDKKPSKRQPVAAAQIAEDLDAVEQQVLEERMDIPSVDRMDIPAIDRDQRNVDRQVNIDPKAVERQVEHREIEKLLQAAPLLENPPKLSIASQRPPEPVVMSQLKQQDSVPQNTFSERSDEQLSKSRFPFGPRNLNLDKLFHYTRDEKARKRRESTEWGYIENLPMFFKTLPPRDGRDLDPFNEAPQPPCEAKVRRRREAVSDEKGKNADVGVEVGYEVVSAVDLAFTPNGTEGVTVFQGRIREEVIYGVCLPSASFTALFAMLTMCVVISVIVAGFLCYHRQIQKSTSEGALTGQMPVQFVQENMDWNVLPCKAAIH